MFEPSIYTLASILVLTAIAAAWDLRTGEIPNRLVIVGALVSAVALVLGRATGADLGLPKLVLVMFAGAVLVTIVPALLYRAGGIGGGDLKLLAVVGAALGPFLGLEVELLAFCVATLYAPVRLIWDGKLVQSLKAIGQLALRPLIPKHRRPPPIALEEMTALRFGPAIFAGALLTALHHIGGAR
jgi:Flp pilus assembly protein protease CpaA